jgi:hypothetical protein
MVLVVFALLMLLLMFSVMLLLMLVGMRNDLQFAAADSRVTVHTAGAATRGSPESA